MQLFSRSILNKKNDMQQGFTLVELVIVIAILAILAVFALAALNPLQQFRKARDGTRKSDLTQIQRALEQYYQDHGNYPPSYTGSYTITDFNGNSVAWGGANGWPPYMNLVPKDVNSDRTYVYYAAGSSPQKYQLYAALEMGPNDPQTCKATVANCQKFPESTVYCTCSGVPVGVNCGANGTNHPCNYGVSSPNTTP